MTRIAVTLSTVAALAMLAPVVASAQQVRCPEGQTASGECVSPGLAARLRTTAIIFAQPKISQTAYPVLPVDDWFYRYPNQVIPNPAKPVPAFSFSP
jgi:hypothetical protein